MINMLFAFAGCMLAFDVVLVIANHELSKELKKNKGETNDDN